MRSLDISVKQALAVATRPALICWAGEQSRPVELRSASFRFRCASRYVYFNRVVVGLR